MTRIDITRVEQLGMRSGSRFAKGNGSDNRRQVDPRCGSFSVLDSCVVDAVSLGQEIERRSLVTAAVGSTR